MTVTYLQLESALASAKASVDASDLHGSVAGYLCGGGTADAAGLLQALELELDDPGARGRLQAEVESLYRDCRAALDDAELGFQPLLPDADRPVDERADSLVEWCRGFLGGFGLATAQRSQALSADGEEILRDFGTIGASDLSCGDSDEDERALVEVSEFVRVGALVLHAETAGKRASGGAPSGNGVH